MGEWKLGKTAKFIKDNEHYQQRQPNEWVAVMKNLDAYFEALKLLGNPMQIQTGFLHHEPDGIKALDQKGGKQKVKLQQTRLYVYPDTNLKILYLLAMGNKSTQASDIRFSREMVKELRSGGGY